MHSKYWFTLLVTVALVGRLPAAEPTGAQIDWVKNNAIPFKTVSFNPETDRWGFNVERVIRRRPTDEGKPPPKIRLKRLL